MGARFARGTIPRLAEKLQNAEATAVPELRRRMETIGEDGKQDMQDRITKSYTRTGLERVESGAGEHAGRRVEDVMYNAVETKTIESAKLILRTEVGWLEQFEDYFGFQDKGTEYIPAMNALRDSGAIMRDEIKVMGADFINQLGKDLTN